jgi:hypothetical protein
MVLKNYEEYYKLCRTQYDGDTSFFFFQEEVLRRAGKKNR